MNSRSSQDSGIINNLKRDKLKAKPVQGKSKVIGQSQGMLVRNKWGFIGIKRQESADTIEGLDAKPRGARSRNGKFVTEGYKANPKGLTTSLSEPKLSE